MTRVHGDILIRRRLNQDYKETYRLFKNDLKEDFHCLCGYCGKNSKYFKEDYQIDHFVPKSLDPERKGDYYNLVYACKQCNRAKWDKWPTNDINVPFNENEGFVDPATEEYDKHIERDCNGALIGKTNVGNYMLKELNLNIRPTDKVWFIMKLYEAKKKLREFLNKNKNDIPLEYYRAYVELDGTLEDYFDYFYDRR